MRLRVVAAAMAAVFFSGHALAQSCPTGTSRVQQVKQLVEGYTMCAVRGSEKWQEFHQLGGALIDWKLGPPPPITVDPTKQVGTWTFSNGANGVVTHNYTGGPSYTWAICEVAPNNFTLVSTTDSVPGVSLRLGQVACP